MADSEESDNSSDEEPQAVIYTCRKCSGMELRKDQLEAHREYHRRERAKKKERSQRHSKRGGSPAPSTTMTVTSDLFITRNKKSSKSGPKRSKGEKQRRKQAKETTRKTAQFVRDTGQMNDVNGG